MNANEKLVFTIKDGAVTCEAMGFKGSACEAATKDFQVALGGKVSNKTRKPEYFQAAPAGSSVNAGGKS